MSRVAYGGLAVIAGALLLVACTKRTIVECSDDASCVNSGMVQGVCLPSPSSSSNWCAYPDLTCPSSTRWGETAGDDLFGRCTPASPVDAGVGDSGLHDATVVDAGGRPDARRLDAGTPDAAIPDAASPDAGPLGAPCISGATCASGYCSDDVCCSAPCDGGCDVCKMSLGASADGVCSLLVAGTQCRSAAGECDVAESCDGVSGSCPADEYATYGTLCTDPDPTVCVDKLCDGAGACAVSVNATVGRPCGDSTDDTCTNLDTCDGFGTCLTNDEANGTACSGGGGDACCAGVCTDTGGTLTCP